MRKIIYFILIFIFSLILIDIILSLFLPKEIYEQSKQKINIISEDKSNKQIDWTEVYTINNIPYWEAEYRGPYYSYEKNKKLNCRILGLGDSIIWGSGVDSDSTYFKKLSNKLKNSELINFGIPGSDALQQIIKFEKEEIIDNDLIIWHLWEDDEHIYKYVNGILYDSRLELNQLGKLFLFKFIPHNINEFFIKNSFIYNKILIIKYNKTIKPIQVSNTNYITSELKRVIDSQKNTKILILFSPSLKNSTYKSDYGWNVDGYPNFYKNIENTFINDDNISLLYLDKVFKGINVEDIRYDDCCHFNEEGHDFIANKLYDYIKTNKLLDEKCY